MFLLGIGGHLKVSHMDPRVSFGNELTNLSVQKSFFKIIAPYFPHILGMWGCVENFQASQIWVQFLKTADGGHISDAVV